MDCEHLFVVVNRYVIAPLSLPTHHSVEWVVEREVTRWGLLLTRGVHLQFLLSLLASQLMEAWRGLAASKQPDSFSTSSVHSTLTETREQERSSDDESNIESSTDSVVFGLALSVVAAERRFMMHTFAYDGI